MRASEKLALLFLGPIVEQTTGLFFGQLHAVVLFGVFECKVGSGGSCADDEHLHGGGWYSGGL